jgi:hypothetical protein
MTTLQRLAHWLATKQRDYRQGVQIFIDLNIDASKIDFFSTPKPGRIHLSILQRELENHARVNRIKPQLFVAAQVSAGKTSALPGKKKLVPGPAGSGSQRPNPPAPDQGKAAASKPRIDTNPVVKYDELPANLQVLFDQNGKLTGEIKTFHAELKACGEDPEKKDRRSELSQAIVSRQKSVRSNWEEIDGWWNSRQDKTPEEKGAQDAIARQKRIQANLNYIRRYHGTVKENQRYELEKRMNELDKWGVSYEELVRKISAPA